MTLILRRDLLLLAGRGIHQSDHIPTMTTSSAILANEKLESFSLILSKKCLLEIYYPSCYYCYACGSRICVLVGEEQHC
jgi:hypothetical protein